MTAAHGMSFLAAFNDRILDNVVGTCPMGLLQYDVTSSFLRSTTKTLSHSVLRTQKHLYKHFQPQQQDITQHQVLLTGRYVLKYTTTDLDSLNPPTLQQFFDLAPSTGDITVASYDLSSSFTVHSEYKYALVLSNTPSRHALPDPALTSSIDVKTELPWLNYDASSFDSVVLLFNRKKKRKLWKRCLKNIFGYSIISVERTLGIDAAVSGSGLTSKRSSMASTPSVDTTTSTAQLGSVAPRRQLRQQQVAYYRESPDYLDRTNSTWDAAAAAPALQHKYVPGAPRADLLGGGSIGNLPEKVPEIPQKSTNRHSIQSFKGYTRRKFNLSMHALDNSGASSNGSQESLTGPTSLDRDDVDETIPRGRVQKRTHSLVYYNNNNNHHMFGRRVVNTAQDFYTDKFLQQALREASMYSKEEPDVNEEGLLLPAQPTGRRRRHGWKSRAKRWSGGSAGDKPEQQPQPQQVPAGPTVAPPSPPTQPLNFGDAEGAPPVGKMLPPPPPRVLEEDEDALLLTPQNTLPSLTHSRSSSGGEDQRSGGRGGDTSGHSSSVDRSRSPPMLALPRAHGTGTGGANAIPRSPGGSNLSVLLNENFSIWAPPPPAAQAPAPAPAEAAEFERELEELAQSDEASSLLAANAPSPSASPNLNGGGGNGQASSPTFNSTVYSATASNSNYSLRSLASSRITPPDSSSDSGGAAGAVGMLAAVDKDRSFQSLESWVSNQNTFLSATVPSAFSSLMLPTGDHHEEDQSNSDQDIRGYGKRPRLRSGGMPNSAAADFSSSEESLAGSLGSGSGSGASVVSSLAVPPRFRLPEIPERCAV